MSEKASIGDYTKLMLFFGKVSEVHIKNLKAFPFIYFNDVTEVKLNYSVETEKQNKANSLIAFHIHTSKDNDKLYKRFKAIEQAVKILFWKDIKVKVTLLPQNEVFQSE